MLEVKVEGLERFVEGMRGFRVDVQTAIREASEWTAMEAANRARSRAPVRTGRLRGSIQTLTASAESKVQVTAPYAGYVEFGTRRMRAQPFLRPSVQEVQHLFPQLFRARVLEAIKR